ncbi:class I SAM-dependent methyltransferase [Aggregatilinea lenta]|uniref:class I SAM-dependent methyltransferase n=1 Tax=Aggregatilinea lenta TaxID=913108 RepID=UPI000E5BF9CC|nr:class I SAM-dependent methyltransferase [Aggregatilinea lenta]
MAQHHKRDPSGWDALARWYDGWVGAHGSEHHRRLAIPATLDLLDLAPDDHLLDIGAGQGVFAPYVLRTGARYTGVEISPRLLSLAQQRGLSHARFVRGDARRLADIPALEAASFDAAAFLLSIQDMNPLEAVLRSAAWALRDGGRLVILMTHPCFRVPRQSGWGHDEARNLQFRRVDSYLSTLEVPMKAYGKQRAGTTISFHRPLSRYINALAACGLLIDALEEITTYESGNSKAERRANAEFPLFVGLRARKFMPGESP